MEGRIGSMIKDVVGCVQALARKNIFLVKFKDRNKKDMISCLLQYLCSKEEVCLEIDDPISKLPEK